MSDNTLDQSNNSVSLQTLAKSGIASEFDTELFDLLTQPACIVNSQGKISLINEEFYKLTMYGKDICSNYSICDILDFPDNVEKRAFLIRLLGKEIPGKVLTYKNLITSNGNRIGVRFSSKYMEKFNCFLLQFEDLSVRQNFTKALLSAKERADNSEKLKTEFLAQMSHEIRTPINAVLSFASLIEDEVQDKISDDLKSGFEIIKRGGDRIIRTVDLILDMSEVMAGTYDFSEKVTDIYYNIFLDIEETYRMFASEKHLEFIVSKETSNTMLELDEYSVRQIFSNILDNAVKFTHSGTIMPAIVGRPRCVVRGASRPRRRRLGHDRAKRALLGARRLDAVQRAARCFPPTILLAARGPRGLATRPSSPARSPLRLPQSSNAA